MPLQSQGILKLPSQNLTRHSRWLNQDCFLMKSVIGAIRWVGCQSVSRSEFSNRSGNRWNDSLEISRNRDAECCQSAGCLPGDICLAANARERMAAIAATRKGETQGEFCSAVPPTDSSVWFIIWVWFDYCAVWLLLLFIRQSTYLVTLTIYTCNVILWWICKIAQNKAIKTWPCNNSASRTERE